MFPLSIGHSMALFAVFFHGSSSLYVKGAANRAAQAWTSTHPFLAADLHPLAFQVYFLLGVCLTSCFGLFAVHSIQFCPWAGASGFLLVLYESLGLCAVYYIGLSVSLAIISSIAILSAFFMGHLLFDNLLWSDSMTSAYPIFHCQALVMVFWNLYLFQETREKTLGVYIVAGFLLITGGLLLSLVVHL